MSTILITGASGFIGRPLAKQLDGRHQLLCLSRKKPEAPGQWVKGTFELFEDLRQLDQHKIDTVVHLAAVTGGCSEEDGINVNVQGTRRLMRYLIDRDTRRFVLASSIAATGCLTNPEPRFVPLQLPMRPNHPCIGRDAYGFSKALMEEVAKHFSRNVADADILALRFGAVVEEAAFDATLPPLATFPPWAAILLGRVGLSDVIRGLEAALAAPPRPGFRVYNLVAPDNCADEPTAVATRTIYGNKAAHLDLSSFERPGHEFDPFWSMDEIREGLGFVARVPMGPAKFKAWKAGKKS